MGKKKKNRKSGKKVISNNKLFVEESDGTLWHDGNAPQQRFDWKTESDVVYGFVDPYAATPSKQYGKNSPVLPGALSDPFSLQWEYEFSPTRIVLTLGGNDVDNYSPQPILRDVITGAFKYNKGKIKGVIQQIASARWEQSSNIEVVGIWEASTPRAFSGLGSLGQIVGRRFQGYPVPSAEFLKIATYDPDPFEPGLNRDGSPLDRSITTQRGLDAYLGEGWQANPFLTNLL